MSDPPLSDIGFKNKMTWVSTMVVELPLNYRIIDVFFISWSFKINILRDMDNIYVCHRGVLWFHL